MPNVVNIQIDITITVSSNKPNTIPTPIPAEKLNEQKKKMGEMVVLIVSESILVSSCVSNSSID